MSNLNEKKAIFESAMQILSDDVKLTGTYINKHEANKAKQAVVFWQTIKYFRQSERIKQIEEVLEEYAKNDDILGLIAKMELLPTPVFRRMLWFYNIDFESPESCLRRLTKEQISGILDTYNDIYRRSMVPKCMKQGLWNRVRQLNPGKRVTIGSIIHYKPADMAADTKIRYSTKGAIAYDFFLWNIGFNSYRKENSDEKIPDNVALQFFSQENHKNGFTVNKEEGGIYWFLYLYGRANYLWGNKDNVQNNEQLKTKFCPGFYLTLFIWIGMILGSPLLLSAMAIKYVGQKSLSFINKFVEEKIEIDEEFWKELIVVTVIVIACYFIANLAKSLFDGFYAFSNENLLYTVSLSVLIVMYLFYMGHYKKWILPYQLPWIGKPLFAYVLIQTFYDNEDSILGFLGYLASKGIEALSAMGNWAANNLFVLSSLFILMAVIALTCFFWIKVVESSDKYLTSQEDKLYNFLEKVYWPLLIFSGTLSLTGFPLLLAIIKYESLNFWSNLDLSFVFMFLAGLTITLYFYISFRDLQPKALKIKSEVENINNFSVSSFYRDTISKNDWIQSLESREQIIVIRKTLQFAKDWIFSRYLAVQFLSSINAENYKLLKQYDGYFRRKTGSDDELINFLIDEVYLSVAIKKIKEKKAKKEKFKKMIQNLLKPILYIGRWVKDLHRLKKTLDESCPYVSVPKQF